MIDARISWIMERFTRPGCFNSFVITGDERWQRVYHNGGHIATFGPGGAYFPYPLPPEMVAEQYEIDRKKYGV